MSVKHRFLITGAAALALTGCVDMFGSNASIDDVAVGTAFQSVPVGFSSNTNSFDAAGDVGPFFPGGPMAPGSSNFMAGDGSSGDRRGPAEGEHRDGFGGPAMHGILMGGGLGPDFMGRIPFGRGLGRGPFGAFNLPDTCTFDSTSGRVTCPDKDRDGIIVKTSFQFVDGAGTAQPKFDTLTTNGVNIKVTVTGTRVRRDSSTSTVNHSSDRTITGLAPGSTERTVNGTAFANETTTGTRDSVSFTAVRTASDTTDGLVIPISDGHPTIPSAGKVIRNMSVTITPAGGTATTKSRREEITFDGTNVIHVKITRDGETKDCTITLPSRRLSCS